ncbi:metallopeptidase [Synechococcus sp. A15-127]|nr:metallopeptidase [Synechococcus sp. A15-127]
MKTGLTSRQHNWVDNNSDILLLQSSTSASDHLNSNHALSGQDDDQTSPLDPIVRIGSVDAPSATSIERVITIPIDITKIDDGITSINGFNIKVHYDSSALNLIQSEEESLEILADNIPLMDAISQLSGSAAGWLVDAATEQSGDGASKLTAVAGMLTETATEGVFHIVGAGPVGLSVDDAESISESNPLHLGSLVFRVPAGTLDQSIDLDLRLEEVLITGSTQDQISATLTTTEVIDGVLTLQSQASTTDTTPPSVKLTHSTLTTSATAIVTAVLSEGSEDFSATDLIATGGEISNFNPISATEYTALFTPTPQSTVDGTVTIGAGAFSDAAGNRNTENELVTITVNTSIPWVSLTTTDDKLTAGETALIGASLSEVSEDFGEDDLDVSGGVLSDFTQVNELRYTALFTPAADSTSDGVISVAIGAFTDLDDNSNATASEISMDVETTVPSVVLTASGLGSDAMLTVGESATISAQLSERSLTFTADDLIVSGGELSDFQAISTSLYTATFTPSVNSTTTGIVQVNAATFSDFAGNDNADDITLSIPVETTEPFLVFTSSDNNLKAGETATITITLSEESPDFSQDSLLIQGGELSQLQASSATSYSGIFTPSAESTTEGLLSIAIGEFSDLAGNTNSADAVINLTVETTVPTISFSSSDDILTAGEKATIRATLSEPIATFSADDLRVSGGQISDFGKATSSFNKISDSEYSFNTVSDTEYTFVMTPTPDSTDDASVFLDANTLTDAAGNSNTTSADIVMTVETTIPTVALSSSDPTLTIGESTILAVELSEPSFDFTLDNFNVSGGALTDFTVVNASQYTALFTPFSDTTTTASAVIEAGSFSDAAGNQNIQAESLMLTIDTIAPELTLSSYRSTLGIGESTQIRFTLSESSSDFGLDDVSVSGGTLSALSGEGTTFEATFTPMVNVKTTATLKVLEERFSDTYGNGNLASDTIAIDVDTLIEAPPIPNRPRPRQLGHPELDTSAAINLSDLVTGMAQRQSAEDILTYLDNTVAGLFQGIAPSLEEADIDGDGQLHPFTDGMVLSLYATSAALDVSDSQQLIYVPGAWEDSHETGVPIVKSLLESSFGTFQNMAG